MEDYDRKAKRIKPSFFVDGEFYAEQKERYQSLLEKDTEGKWICFFANCDLAIKGSNFWKHVIKHEEKGDALKTDIKGNQVQSLTNNNKDLKFMEEKQPNMSSFINTKPGLENSNLPSVSSSSHATNTISSNLPGFQPNPPLRPQSTQWRTWGQNQEAWVSTIISDQDQERKSTHKRSNSVLHRPIDKEHKMKQRQKVEPVRTKIMYYDAIWSCWRFKDSKSSDLFVDE